MTKSMINQGTSSDAQKALFGMFTCFNLGGNELERKARHDAYWAVLAVLPPSAVAASCHDAAKGGIGDGCFVPTAAMIYQRALSYLPRSQSVAYAPKQLDRCIPPGERQRVKNGFVALCAALKGSDLTGELEVPSASIRVLKDIAEIDPGYAKNSLARDHSVRPLREWISTPIDALIAPPQLSAELRAKMESK